MHRFFFFLVAVTLKSKIKRFVKLNYLKPLPKSIYTYLHFLLCVTRKNKGGNPDFVIIHSKKKMVKDIKMQLFEYALLF